MNRSHTRGYILNFMAMVGFLVQAWNLCNIGYQVPSWMQKERRIYRHVLFYNSISKKLIIYSPNLINL